MNYNNNRFEVYFYKNNTTCNVEDIQDYRKLNTITTLLLYNAISQIYISNSFRLVN